MTSDEPNLDPDLETEELRILMRSSGITEHLESDLTDIEFESAESVLARLKSAPPNRWVQVAAALRRPLVRTALIATAAAVIAGILVVIQPWGNHPARASIPPILDFEFAEAQRIADAPGVDPAETFEQLARAAERTDREVSPSAIQHVVHESWTIEMDFDRDPNSTVVARKSENWIHPDGRFRTRSYSGSPLEADGRGIPLPGRIDRTTKLIDEETRPLGEGSDQYPQLFTSMPNSIEGVRARLLDQIKCLERHRGQERSLCLYLEVQEAPHKFVVPSRVMAIFWRMLAQEEGYRSLGRVKDRSGRESVAISFIWEGSPNHRFVILADPRTGDIVGREDILIKPSIDSPVKPPSIQHFSTIVKSEAITPHPPN